MEVLSKMEKNSIFKIQNINADYKKLIEAVRAGKSCSIFGVQNSMRPALVSGLNKRLFYICADNMSAASAVEQFKLMGLKTDYIPSISDCFLYKKSGSVELFRERSKSLFNIAQNNTDVVVAPVESLL